MEKRSVEERKKKNGPPHARIPCPNKTPRRPPSPSQTSFEAETLLSLLSFFFSSLFRSLSPPLSLSTQKPPLLSPVDRHDQPRRLRPVHAGQSRQQPGPLRGSGLDALLGVELDVLGRALRGRIPFAGFVFEDFFSFFVKVEFFFVFSCLSSFSLALLFPLTPSLVPDSQRKENKDAGESQAEDEIKPRFLTSLPKKRNERKICRRRRTRKTFCSFPFASLVAKGLSLSASSAESTSR